MGKGEDGCLPERERMALEFGVAFLLLLEQWSSSELEFWTGKGGRRGCTWARELHFGPQG